MFILKVKLKTVLRAPGKFPVEEVLAVKFMLGGYGVHIVQVFLQNIATDPTLWRIWTARVRKVFLRVCS